MSSEPKFRVVIRREELGGQYGYEVFYVDVMNEAGVLLEAPGLQVWHPATTHVDRIASMWASFLGVDVEYV